MTWSVVMPYISSFGLVAGALAVIVAGFRQSASNTWRANAEAEKARGDRLETEVNQLKQQVAVLTDMVTGQHAIEMLSANITARFDKLEVIVRGGGAG